MTSAENEVNLPDVPDLTGIDDNEPTAWENGWYAGTIIGKREFTDKNGNERVFESNDTPAQRSGRNVRLQVQLKRQSDGREMNTSTIINYQPDDLTQETIQKVTVQKEKVKKEGDDWNGLFRPFMTLTRLGKLQKIAGVRQLQRDTDGALNLTPLFGKSAYFKLKDDERSGGKYKEIADFREDKPKKAAVL